MKHETLINEKPETIIYEKIFSKISDSDNLTIDSGVASFRVVFDKFDARTAITIAPMGWRKAPHIFVGPHRIRLSKTQAFNLLKLVETKRQELKEAHYQKNLKEVMDLL